MIFDELWKKQRSRGKLARSYDDSVNALVKAKDFKGAESLREEAAHFVSEADDEIAFIRSRELIKRARRLPVPLPDYPDERSWDESWGKRVLSDKGCADLLSSIRQEENERIKHGFRWWKEVLIPIGTFILGIMGTYLAMKHH